jgi:hypothetical protein
MEINAYGPLRLTPTAVDADGVCASQSPAAGAILINGAFATGGVATITNTGAHLVRLTSGGDDSGITFTITGTDSDGRAVSETVAGTNASNSDTTKYFKTITGITHTGTVAGTVIVGNLIDSVSNTILPNLNTSPIAIGIGVQLVSGTVTYKVQHSYQDWNSAYPTLWWDHSTGAKSASFEFAYSAPVGAIRLLVSASSSAVLRAAVLQGG